MRACLAGLALLSCSAVVAVAQEAPPRFDVVSIKRNTSTDPASSLRPEPNGLTGVNVQTMRLVRVAYQVASFQIVDAPGWFTSERYDIAARATGPVAMAQLAPMVRALLADRFGLRLVQRRRESKVLELRADGGRTHRLKPSSQPCGLAQAKDGPIAPAVSRTAPPCFVSDGESLIGRGVTTEMLAQELTRRLEQFVVDRSALAGVFDFDLRWSPDAGAASPPGDAPASDFPPLVTAVREQLGLQLLPARAAVDVYVVEAASRPLPD
jgi:uncharacterized protein (TIGR03435 family)